MIHFIKKYIPHRNISYINLKTINCMEYYTGDGYILTQYNMMSCTEILAWKPSSQTKTLDFFVPLIVYDFFLYLFNLIKS